MQRGVSMSLRTTSFHRAAIAIHERLCHVQDESCLTLNPTLPERLLDECGQLMSLTEKARQRGYIAAALQMKSRTATAIRRVTTTLENLERQLSQTPVRTPPSIRDILSDLESLAGEFDDVSVNMPRHSISVTTDEVILEGVDLGRFEIILDWSLIQGIGAYEVIAVDDCAAATDCDTTHPHVQCNSLCEGEGKAPIRAALDDGRLFDFFVLVRQILHTYNPSSAYVQLEDWFGIRCPECGSTVSSDESNHCEGCSTTTCFECSTHCTDCDYRYCSDCIRTCTGCESDTCSSCRSVCSECGDGFCKGCIDDGRCLLCIENSEEEANKEKEREPVSAT